MKTENCREWRESLGAYALGHLPEDERAGLEAHLEGCPSCRAEAQSLSGVAALLPLGDPARFGPAPQPPRELGDRVMAAVGGEQRTRSRKRRLRLGFGLGAATAAATAVVLLLVLGGGGGEKAPEQWVKFGSLPQGMEITAVLEPHAFGTEIQMYVKGVRSGTLCRVFLRGPGGKSYPAGSFRYRWGEDSDAVLSSALDLSRTEAIGVHAGARTFIAPVKQGEATAVNEGKQEST